MPSLPPSPSSGAIEPYVLVADDDATTLCFLGDAFRQLGAQVVLSPDGTTALNRARTEAFDLLLLDCRMPDAGAVSVLKQLRDEATAKSACSPAVASSAELDVAERRSLLEAGFHAVLLKPCTLRDLRDILALAKVRHRQALLLDDTLALDASGTPVVVQALRKLFRQELLDVYEHLDALSSDTALLETRLHKLRSSCGFCGATALAEHIFSLQRHLKLAHRGAMLPLGDFRQSVLQTIEALDASNISGA
jgi:two-component system, OmpR family, response regulator